jgi:hypothetical protein
LTLLPAERFGIPLRELERQISTVADRLKGENMRRTILLVLLLAVPVVAAVVKTTGQEGTYADRRAPEKWEYLSVAGPSSTNFSPTGSSSMRKEDSSFGREAFVLEQHLDKLGAKGWELVSVAGPPTDPVYYFKRRK